MPVTSTVDVVKTRVFPCSWTSSATIDGKIRDFPQPVVPWTWMWRQPLRISFRSSGICLAMVVCCGRPGHIKNKYRMLYIWNIVSLNRRMYCNRCCHRFCLRITVHFRENIICKNDVCVIWQSCKCHIKHESHRRQSARKQYRKSKHYDTLWHLCKDQHVWSAQVFFPVALTSQHPTRLAVTT